MKFTEGAFRDWGYQLSVDEFGGEPLDGGPWHVIKNPNNGNNIVIKDVICDAFLQQILTRPKEYDVIATMNLNGDYISDALAACVGGIGIAPGANIGDSCALFEATHGTAPKYAGQDKVNPGSLMLSAEMMLRHIGWADAADLIISSMEKAIVDKMVTYDFERLMDDANLVSCSGFANEMIKKNVNDLSKDTSNGEALGTVTLEKKPEVKEPPLFQVVLLNDDYTPMEFVVFVIQKIFGYEHGKATEIMLSVHNKGKGVCGIFSKEIAEMKCNEINNLAQAHEHPLLSEIEPLSD